MFMRSMSDKKSLSLRLDIVNFCLAHALLVLVMHAARHRRKMIKSVSQEPNFTAGGATFLFIRQISLRHGAGSRSRTCKRQKLRAPYFGAAREKCLDQRASSFFRVRDQNDASRRATLPERLDFICLRRLWITFRLTDGIWGALAQQHAAHQVSVCVCDRGKGEGEPTPSLQLREMRRVKE